MKETFATPAVGAIIRRSINNEPHILIQTRNKANDCGTNGLLEIPAGKVREYENLYSALRREVREETGLIVTRIEGEDKAFRSSFEHTTICAQPFCINQNLSGAYSIILSVFLCEADGEPLTETDETCNIHWMKEAELIDFVKNHSERFFLMSLNPLRKYFGI